MANAYPDFVPSNPKKDHYIADACILSCIDARFSAAIKELKKSLGLKMCDLIQVAGGAKGLSNENEEGKYLKNQILTSIRLHRPKIIILTSHTDCGAYGGLAAFGGDEFKERKVIENDLKKAGTTLQKILPDPIPILLYFCTFQGLQKLIQY